MEYTRSCTPTRGPSSFPEINVFVCNLRFSRMLDFEGNHKREEEVERQQERILGAPQVVTDRKYPFSEDLIRDSSRSVDVSLPVLAKVSVLVEALPLGSSYELVQQLWSQFTLIAGQVNVDVTWSRDEVLVSGFLLPYYA